MTPKELKNAYDRGENISALLREQSRSGGNSEDIILMSYDLQAGSYAAAQSDPQIRKVLDAYCQSLADQLSTLGPQASMLEAGVGEATTLVYVLKRMTLPPPVVHGVDISWSRVATGRRWFLEQHGDPNTRFIVGSMTRLPYADNSFDIVYTSHAVEPNGGREKAILSELYRVCSKYLVLCEPAYEFASEDARARMDQHGYCKNLAGHSRELGMQVVKSELLLPCINADNPTAITLIAKNPNAAPAEPAFACPRWKTPLQYLDDCWFSPDSLYAYPLIKGIPCLNMENGIIASKLSS